MVPVIDTVADEARTIVTLSDYPLIKRYPQKGLMQTNDITQKNQLSEMEIAVQAPLKLVRQSYTFHSFVTGSLGTLNYKFT